MALGFAGIFGGNTRTAPVVTAKPPPVNQLQTKAETAFGPALKSALHPVARPAGVVASQKHAVSARVLAAGDRYTPSASLTLLNGLPPVITSPSPTGTATPATLIPADSGATVVDTLKAALTQAGVDISGMQFSRHQDIVTYPGGSYVNDMISFSANSGQTHEYMTNLVGIAPQVTVAEIQQLMAGNRW